MVTHPKLTPLPSSSIDDIEDAFITSIEALGPYENEPHIAVGVSGGADSMALTLLLDKWVKTIGGKLTALTVDHKLRDSAKSEAEMVHQQLTQMSVEHHILENHAELANEDIQNYARNVRYQLMSDWCKKHHVLYLALGHHRDDNEETILYRFLRGSSTKGLSGISARAHQHGICLLRPLLNYSKAFWQSYVEQRSVAWIEEPSNRDERFARTHMRSTLKSLKQQPQTDVNILTTAKHMQRQYQEEQAIYYQHAIHCMMIEPEGYGYLIHDKLMTMPENMAVRMLSECLQTISGSAYPCRYQTALQLYESFKENPSQVSAHGCLLKRIEEKWLCYREPSTLPQPLSLLGRYSGVWNDRFAVKVNTDDTTNYLLCAIGPRTARALKEYTDLPIDVLQTLPCLKIKHEDTLETLAMAPHINYRNDDFFNGSMSAEFSPADASNRLISD